MLDKIKFKKVQLKDGLIGVCSFCFNKDFYFSQIHVYKLKIPKGDIRIRLLYPERIAPSATIQKEIDNYINAHIIGQYPEILK